MGTKVSTSESFDFSDGGKKWGWKWDAEANLYQTDGENIDDGTYCMDANIGVGTDLGTAGDPQVATFLATGSIMMNGNPYLTPAHPDSIMMIAEGDLKLNGSPASGFDTFEGLVYGGAQCEMNGDPVIHGQLICKNNPDPPGSEDIVSVNKLNGDMELTFMCGGIFAGAGGVVPIAGRNWSHVW